MISRPISLACVAAASFTLLAPARTARAQGATACNSEQERQTAIKLPSGEYNNFLGGGIVVRCPAKRITLRADSAELYGDDRRIFFVGKVRYSEPRLELSSDYLTYFQTDERILAAGNVDARLPTGSTLRGPQVDYRRAVPRVRTRAQTLATGRPQVSIAQQPDQAGKAQPPIDVVANTIYMDGDSLIYGSGAVEIRRPEVSSKSDSAFINLGIERMELLRNPVLRGERGRPFQLVGERVDLFAHDRKLQRVLARARAEAVSRELTLRADTIDLRIVDDQLERAYAWGAGRAHVTSPTQTMVADSMDVLLPDQRVREVRSIGGAVAEGRPDSTNFRADTTDWLRGARILAYFDSTATADTTRGPAIRRLVALDSARAYYNLAPQDTSLRRPAISYVKGKRITIDFGAQRVATIVVEEQVSGIHLEPTADTTAARPNAPPRPAARPRAVPPAASGAGARRP